MLLLVVSAKWLLQGSAVPGPQTVALFDFIQNGHMLQNPEGTGIFISNSFLYEPGWVAESWRCNCAVSYAIWDSRDFLREEDRDGHHWGSLFYKGSLFF